MAKREPLWLRLRNARHAARERVAARTTTKLTEKQLAVDAFTRGVKTPMDKLVDVSIVVAAALIVHGTVFGIGKWLGSGSSGDRNTGPVVVEMREQEKKQESKEEKTQEKKIEEPKPQIIEKPKLTKPTPKVEPPPETPEPTAKRPPPKVVGLSLGNTVEGGGGPAFNVGETRKGTTEKVANDPKNKPDAKAPEPKKAEPKSVGTGKGNKTATRIPTAGAGKYVLPKRKNKIKPVYPETLKSQGIEANVTVIVSIDETGKVTSVKIAKGSPHDAFNKAAEAAAWKEGFAPATRGGKAIPYTLSFTYRFRLDDK